MKRTVGGGGGFESNGKVVGNVCGRWQWGIMTRRVTKEGDNYNIVGVKDGRRGEREGVENSGYGDEKMGGGAETTDNGGTRCSSKEYKHEYLFLRPFISPPQRTYYCPLLLEMRVTG